MNPVIHFEMPAEDMKRMSDFYSQVFGWGMQGMGPDMGNYQMVTTTPSGKNGPTSPGAINGGFFPKSSQSSQYPSIVINVDDIEASMKQIIEKGGKILGKPMPVGDMALYVSFTDPEGNRCSLWQPLTKK